MEVKNELGVIVRFCRTCCGMENEGWSIVSIQSEFPDAVVKSLNGDELSAEFEFLSSNFKTHGHDIRECDLIICWEDNWNDCIISVLELSTGEFKKRMPLNTDREIAYLRMEVSRLAGLNIRLHNKIELLESCDDVAINRIVNPEDLNKRQVAILEVLREDPKINYTQLGEIFGVSRTTATSDVKILIDAGLVRKNGNGWKVTQE